MDDKDIVKDRSDIVDTVREYLELKPAGSQSFKALCPFHHEKSPSLHISQDKQIWHCFGCGKGGDVFAFVMEMQGIGFREALEQLARKAGVQLTQKRSSDSSAKSHIFSLNEMAATFFETVLQKHELGEEGRKYLDTRGISLEEAKKFKLGFAPDSWDSLIKVFGGKGIPASRLLKSGLAKNGKKGSPIDLFRNRLMIPIRDVQGRVLGFTGRAISSDAYGPKYLNTPETDVFHKRSLLHGIFEGRSAIRVEDAVIIAEGNLDIIASHRAGVEHIVASSGTALTEDQLRLLKRMTSHLLFCFDSDAAGFRAAQKGIHIAQSLDMRVQVLTIPEVLGKDPDEVVSHDPEVWKKIVAEPIPIMQFYLNEFSKLHDINEPRGRSAFIKSATEELQYLKDPVERDFWIQRIADLSHADSALVKEVLRGHPSIKSTPVTSKEAQSSSSPSAPHTLSKTEIHFYELLSLIIESGSELKDIPLPDDIPKALRPLYKEIVDLYNDSVLSADSQSNKQKLLNHLVSPEREFVRPILMRVEELLQVKEQPMRDLVQKHAEALKQITKDERKQALEADIRIAEQKGDQERLQQLLKEYQSLI